MLVTPAAWLPPQTQQKTAQFGQHGLTLIGSRLNRAPNIISTQTQRVRCDAHRVDYYWLYGRLCPLGAVGAEVGPMIGAEVEMNLTDR